MFFAIGKELVTDENQIIAIRAAEQGVKVVWEQYDAVPHMFTMIFPDSKASARCLSSVGNSIHACVESDVKNSAPWIAFKTLDTTSVDLGRQTNLIWEYAVDMMRNAQSRRLYGFKIR